MARVFSNSAPTAVLVPVRREAAVLVFGIEQPLHRVPLKLAVGTTRFRGWYNFTV